ncbi:gamma-glutamyltransferase [Halorhodospira halochloris]|uniref:gamma-glutamyltransferase n=1 Tax=Halorhodospira halochloris TaxID=1052 RepID=UPI0013A5AB83|nr:gamma-glutamyltransferase [Halorhodospira halochloris]
MNPSLEASWRHPWRQDLHTGADGGAGEVLRGTLKQIKHLKFKEVFEMPRPCIAISGLVILLLVGIAGCSGPSDVSTEEPESAAAKMQDGGAMLAAAHPLAADAGEQILANGGSAVDAAIAMQMVLTLVEPQSSGIGGGAFMLYHDAETGKPIAYDGREEAPAAVASDMFLDEQGAELDFFDAAAGGQSVGVPGLLRMLEMVHDKHGSMDWELLFKPAIQHAEQGFKVSSRLHSMLDHGWRLADFNAASEYFFTAEGEPLPEGYKLRNEELAASLEKIAEQGAEPFYTGELADEIVATVQEKGGKLSHADMAEYQPAKGEPLCTDFVGNQVCSIPPPSSGGIATLQILSIYAHAAAKHEPQGEADKAHLLAEASRLAFADRNTYLGDPQFVTVPLDDLLDEEYLSDRARQIAMDSSMGEAAPGLNDASARSSADRTHSTSHLVAVDKYGNVVSMTASVEMPFGSQIMVGGFMLNNQLTDFDFQPRDADGNKAPNRVEPGKRPLSSMTPVIAYNGAGEPRLAIGSPGGTRIIGYVSQRLIDIIKYDSSLEEAIQTGNIVNRNGPTELEEDTARVALAAELEERGHEVEIEELNSGLHAIYIDGEGRLHGAADPRREGEWRRVINHR